MKGQAGRVLVVLALTAGAGCIPSYSSLVDTPAAAGVVLDGTDGTPVVGARVAYLDQGPEATTDADGAFLLPETSTRRFSLMMAGHAFEYLPVVAEHPGYANRGYTVVSKSLREPSGNRVAPAAILLLASDDITDELGDVDCVDPEMLAHVLAMDAALPRLRDEPWFESRAAADPEWRSVLLEAHRELAYEVQALCRSEERVRERLEAGEDARRRD